MRVVCCPGEDGRGGLVGGRGGVEDGAVPLSGHHGPRIALSAGRHLAALSGQHCQLEGVQLHTGTQTQAHTQAVMRCLHKEQKTDFLLLLYRIKAR